MSAPQVTIAEKLRTLGPPPWAREINNKTLNQLVKDYTREVEIHRDLILSGAPVPATWRNFRQFMYDVGPCPPGEGYVLAVKDDTSRVYDRGEVAWQLADDPDAYYWRKAEGSASGYWNRPRRLTEAEFDPLLELLRSGLDIPPPPPEDEANKWAPSNPERWAEFTNTFRRWHSLVRPAYRGSARPAFLYLYTALAMAIEAREELKGAGLWGKKDLAAEMNCHPAWQGYCDHLERAEMALGSLPELLRYSPHTQLDQLYEEVVRTERQFRKG